MAPIDILITIAAPSRLSLMENALFFSKPPRNVLYLNNEQIRKESDSLSIKSFAMRTMDKLKAFRPGKAQKAKLYGELEDGSLLRACIAGDEQAMAAFVSRFQKHIHTVVGRTIRKYTNDVDPTVIDDLTQEVFVSLFENERRRLRTYEGRDGAPLKAWLRVIASATP